MSNSRPLTDPELIAEYLVEVMKPLPGIWSAESEGDTVEVHYFPPGARTDQDEIWLAWMKVEGSVIEIHTKIGPVPRINLADPNSDVRIREFFKSYLRW